MNDQPNRPQDDSPALDEPAAEIKGLLVDPHPELQGRVQRDINRRTLAGDSLNFSLTVMLQTFWEYLRTVMESLPGRDGNDHDHDHDPRD